MIFCIREPEAGSCASHVSIRAPHTGSWPIWHSLSHPYIEKKKTNTRRTCCRVPPAEWALPPSLRASGKAAHGVGGADRFGEAEQVFPPLPLSPAQPVTKCRLHDSSVKLIMTLCRVCPYTMLLGDAESMDWANTGIRLRDKSESE